ncbi:MAG TPA: nuclear transport factor 2 family protein [Ilumatobacteraceae bacterium]|nr:nuclear transport factor 2 family protein [Ilumatobacteraceae bacterium]
MSEPMSPEAIDALADRIFAAIEVGDTATIKWIWADDVVVWHNTDGIEQDRRANLRVLDWMVWATTLRSYRNVRRTIVAGGFVQQHVLHVELPDGRTADVPAAVFVEVDDGRVTRIDEYLDGAGIDAAFGQ